MEHRWGKRIPLQVTVRLDARPVAVVMGRMCNASLSGAYVEASLPPPPLTRVWVEFASPSPPRRTARRVPAYVVRTEQFGVGLEWSAFAPREVRALLRWAARAEWRRCTAAATPATVRIAASRSFRPGGPRERSLPGRAPPGYGPLP